MSKQHTLTRRDSLKLAVAGSAGLILPFGRRAFTASGPAAASLVPLPAPYTVPFAVPPVLRPDKVDDIPGVNGDGVYSGTDYYLIRQQLKDAEILPGVKTPIYGYNGITPGPTISVQKGRQVVVYQQNELPDRNEVLGFTPWTSTHLHGSCSLPQYDGYASDITPPRYWKRYAYPNEQDARTLWYHDHGVHHTAENAYLGLAAQYHLHDSLEAALPIPKGDYDLPLILKDVAFAANGTLAFNTNDDSGMFGDVNLVNGRPWPVLKVQRRKYRFRVLNASVSRSFNLKLSTGGPMTVIATDGGLMPGPQPVTSLKIGMAERYEIVIDFSKYRIGQRVTLDNVSPKNNINFPNTGKIMAFDVLYEPATTDNNEVPAQLNPDSDVMRLQPSDATVTRDFRFDRDGGQWTINGTTWEDVIKSNYKLTLANPRRNAVEIWNLRNLHGGWFHPVHIHLVDFKILDRNGKPPFAYELGAKDVAYCGENESVRVIMRFAHNDGRYMMHCHNLVHEDHDMMAQFEVGTGGPDPINADPAQPGGAPSF